MFQIEIPKRASCCVKGGELFLQGEEYYSSLVRVENEEVYQRLDYCPVCWEKTADLQASQHMSSSWKSTVPLKKEASELPKRRDDRALYLLKEVLAGQESNSSIAEAFVLALYLARRRLVFLRQEVKREGKLPLCVYEVAETEEMLCVPKLSIADLQVEKVQLDLAKKFNAK
ncbi:MAG TPA: hypothetical protein VGP47_05550 [Parachlamydiaceae bacterium]|nr:hypothetical protein [Parachlamydiaceae bacterium]